MKFEYQKEEASIIKGIALIAMFFHHFFGFSKWRNVECSFISIPVGSTTVEALLASFFKICVGLYAFTSGYSLIRTANKKFDLWFITKRAIKFLYKYWIVFALYLIFAVIFNEPFPPVRRFIQQCFGISTATGFSWKYFDAIHPVFAWYVSFYLMFLYLAPLLTKLCRYGFWRDNVLIFIVLFGGTYILTQSGMIILPATINKLISSFATWGHIAMIGYLFAKYDVFNIVHTWLTKHFNRVFILFLVIASIFLMIAARYFLGAYIIDKVSYYSIYTPILIYAVLYIIKMLNLSRVKKILIKLSSESTNMWFLHGIFFTPNRTIQWLAYLPKYPILILIWTLALMYLCSRLITFSTVFVQNTCKKISKRDCS